jgi:hypothetical protein
VLSTHRANYAHLDREWSDAGRGALRDLLSLLIGDSAIFFTDVEIAELLERGWSVRPIGNRGVLLRNYGAAGRGAIRFPAPDDATFVVIKEGRAAGEGSVTLADGQVHCEVQIGEYLLEWKRG